MMEDDDRASMMQIARAIVERDLRAHHTINRKYELSMLIARRGKLYIAFDIPTERLTVLLTARPDEHSITVLDTGGSLEYRPGQWIEELLIWFKQVQGMPVYKLHAATIPSVN